MTRAELPAQGYSRPNPLSTEDGTIIVTVIEEGSGRSRRFPFHTLRIERSLQHTLAVGFARATGPGGTRRTLSSSETLYAGLRVYATYLAAHPHPPSHVSGLAPIHINEVRNRGTKSSNHIIHSLRAVLRSQSTVPSAFLERLLDPLPNAESSVRTIAAYTSAEFRAIRRSVRSIVRDALLRVRSFERELDAAKVKGEHTLTPRELELLHLARNGDVPRYLSGDRRHRGTGAEGLFPTLRELTAAAILLQCMTGQNIGTILTMTSEHHRADDQASEEPLAQTRTRKPRRGPRKAEQDSPFDSADVWSDEDGSCSGDRREQAQAADDFNSAAGVYLAILELCARARSLANTNRLLVGFTAGARRHEGSGAWCRTLETVSPWAANIAWSLRGSPRVGINSLRIRRSYVEQRQKPVDHSPQTLRDEYLVKDPGSLMANQVVVADALTHEVRRIQVAATVIGLTNDQVTQARLEPEFLSRELGVTPELLIDLLDGRLDTVATGCVDNHNSPFSRSGSPCSASFLKCLGCRNAFVEPRHLPVLLALRDTMTNRAEHMDPDDWARSFLTAQTQLDDILARLHEAGTEVSAHPPVEPRIRELIELLLDGKLDLR